MQWVRRMRSPRLSFVLTLVSLVLGAVALTSSYWCVGSQKMPKPLCSPNKQSNCIPVPGASNSASVQFSWETGDDRFVFPVFHTGLFASCEENIYMDYGAMMWLSLAMEIMYVGLLCISCLLLFLQLGLALFPSAQRWGQLLNSFAAVFTVLGGLVGMVAHMMFMQVFQTTASMGPEDFKPHSYGYSYSFYIAWIAFTICMWAGVSTLNDYTKKILMVRLRRNSSATRCGFDYVGPPPPAPYYTPPHPAAPLDCPESPPPLSHLSPYYDTPSPPSSPSLPRLKHSHSLPLPRCDSFSFVLPHSDSFSFALPHSDSFPPPPSHPAPLSPFDPQPLSPSPSNSAHRSLPGNRDSVSFRCYPGEEYSPL